MVLSLSLFVFFSQTHFSFAGALKYDEIIRAVNSVFTRYSSVPIRSKFSRLREAMLVLTWDPSMTTSGAAGFKSSSPAQPLSMSTVAATIVSGDSFSILNINDVERLLSLRVDMKN